MNKLLEQRKEATAKEPIKSQPAPLLDYDPAEDDALSTLMQVHGMHLHALCLLRLPCCTCCGLAGSMSILVQAASCVMLHCVGGVSACMYMQRCLGHGQVRQQLDRPHAECSRTSRC